MVLKANLKYFESFISGAFLPTLFCDWYSAEPPRLYLSEEKSIIYIYPTQVKISQIDQS